MGASDCSSDLRRSAGSEAEELTALCRPGGAGAEAGEQAAAAYRALAGALGVEGSSFADLATETLFLRDVRRDLPAVLDARARVLGALGQAERAPRPVCIGQAPLDEGAALELAASAVLPRHRRAAEVRDLALEAGCACAGCVGSGARLVRVGARTVLHSTNLYGTGGDVFEQALGMFRMAERLLEACGMDFRDVVRTWIHLHDIDRDYDALNAARREFFRQRGIALRPASTGVGGTPFPGVHDCSLVLQAIRTDGPLEVVGMSTPSLNEAWSYGADFSRGLRLADPNRLTLLVSGTASIDDAGRSVHPGDFEAQAERMLDNIASLLAGQGTDFTSIVSVTTYLKRPGDASALRAIYRRRGFAGFPAALVRADLCRPELLCEAEAVAVLPAGSIRA